MPTYEFRCPDGTVIEKFFKISEVPETIPSPKGDGEAVRMITGGAGLLFKGSGFYITDYGKDGKKDQRDAAAKPKSDAAASNAAGSSSDGASAAKSESKGDAKGDAKGESKSDAKSESKSDAKPAAESAPKSEKPAAPAAPPKKD